MAAVKCHLFYDKRPLAINPELAELVGLEPALVLHQIHYWVELNERANRNFQDGFFWTYNTFNEWRDQFPFWSLSTVKRLIKNLEERKLIIVGRFNKTNLDRTKWYRINHETFIQLCGRRLVQNEPMEAPDSVKLTLPSGQSEPMGEATDSVKLTPTIPLTNNKGLTAKTNGAPIIPALSKVPIFRELQLYLGFPERTNKDPIPSYGKEARFVDRMKKRGYTEAEILGYWKRRIDAAGGVYVEAWKINEDIGRDRTAIGKQGSLLPTENELAAAARSKGLVK